MFRCIFSLQGTVHSLPILCAVLDKAAAQNTRMCAQDLKISLLKNKEINNIIYLCTSCLVALAALRPSAVRRKKSVGQAPRVTGQERAESGAKTRV